MVTRSFLPPRMRSNFPDASWSRSLSTSAVSAETDAVLNLTPSVEVAGVELVVSAAAALPLRHRPEPQASARRRQGFRAARGIGRGNHVLDAGRRQVGALGHRHGGGNLRLGRGKSAAGVRRESQGQGDRRARQKLFEPCACHQTCSKIHRSSRGHGCCQISEGKYQHRRFIDTGGADPAAAILLIILWNWRTAQTNLPGVAPPHHRCRRRRYRAPATGPKG